MQNQDTRPDNPTMDCCNCGCIGYAYVPIQKFKDTFKPAVALNKGTLFPELELTISEYGKVCKATGGIM